LAGSATQRTPRRHLASRQQVAELRGHADFVHAIAWSPDGTRLITGSGDFTMRVWDSLSAQDRAKRAATTLGGRELAQKVRQLVLDFHGVLVYSR
jgi:WD40 repeat protein